MRDGYYAPVGLCPPFADVTPRGELLTAFAIFDRLGQ